MRIAHVMAGAVHGGAELFFERLCAAMHGAGDTVLPVIRHDPERSVRLRQAGTAPAAFRFGPWWDRSTRPALGRALRDFAPEIVVSWMNRATALTPRGPWVHVGRLGAYYDLRHYRRCDHLIGNTQGIVAWLRRQGWPDARTHYLPNFVQDCGGAAPASGLAALRRPLVLGLGRLHTDKGFDVLIRAMARLPEATLAIAGEGPEAAALAALTRAEGVADRVRFLGWREDVPALLAAADVFVSSSRIEPLGNMVIEAWSASRPVVACAADGPRELIRDGRDGLVVPLEDPTALAAAVRRAMAATVAEPLAAAGRRRFLDEFSRDVVTRRWRETLHRLLPGHANPDRVI